MNRSVLFYRDYHGLTGGHLKVRDYFQHVRHTAGFTPRIYFSADSSFDEQNPWCVDRDSVLREWDPCSADIWFLAGTDWLAIPETLREGPPVPIINLIQSTRHCNPSDIRYSFFQYPAVRICISREVAAGINDTGIVRGPVYTIDDCLDFSGFPAPTSYGNRKWDVIIGALKYPEMGKRLFDRLRGLDINAFLLTNQVPRSDYLSLLSQSRVALLLPHQTEGFYLPALECMALETIVVCPDCVGNRSFCIDRHNSFRPPYIEDDLIAATREALRLGEGERSLLINCGKRTATAHDIAVEREAFADILANIDDLWQSALTQ